MRSTHITLALGLTLSGLLVLSELSPGLFAQTGVVSVGAPTQGASTPNGGNSAIVIRPGDTVSITELNAPDLSRDVRVSADGRIYLPIIGDIPVGNLSESEAAHSIDAAFLSAHVLLHPQTSVLIREFASKGVTVLGEVAHPNIYPIAGARSLVDVLALAGGFTSMANARVIIKRGSGAAGELTVDVPVDNGRMDLNNDVPVYPGDQVVVQRAGLVYVLGEVTRPGGYSMQPNGMITVLQAVAAANGTTRVSGEKKVVIIRRSASGYITQPVNLRAMYKGKASDFALEPNDVIYVPDSDLRNLVINAPAILGTLAGATIYSFNR